MRLLTKGARKTAPWATCALTLTLLLQACGSDQTTADQTNTAAEPQTSNSVAALEALGDNSSSGGGTPTGQPATELLTAIQQTMYAENADDFYDIPNPIPAGKPGDIIKTREVTSPHFPEAKVVQIMYLSTDVNNQLAPVTGTVLIPNTDLPELPGGVQLPLATVPALGEIAGGRLSSPTGGAQYESRPVVGITPGTRGMGDHCAPSKGFNIETLSPLMVDYSTAEYHQLLARGFVVAITDYVGGGTKLPETYLVGRPEGRAGLDVIRAALNLPDTGADSNSMIGLTGYSQGGQAAAWAAQLQPEYAPELNFKGFVAGGVVTDMTDFMDFFNQGALMGSGFMIAAMMGLDNAYPELDLQSYIRPEAEGTFEAVRNHCVYQQLAAYPMIRSYDLTYPDFVNQPQVRDRLNEQRLGTMAPQVPVYIYHGNMDNIVPYQFGERLRDAWCAKGVSVEYRSGPYEHLAGIFVGAPGGVQFLADRFAGVPPLSNCSANPVSKERD